MFQSVVQHLTTWYMGLLARWRFKPFKNWAIRRLIRKHKVDLTCVKEPNIEKYANFNEFFTRSLKPESRPIASSPLAIASPADGFISQIGDIREGQIIQAKNATYTVDKLIGRPSHIHGLNHGHFVNLYLSPRDYHRVHMPITGTLKEMIYIPGNLFSVNPVYVETIADLFTRNERVVALFETEIGCMALILVGAMVVGKIETVWQKRITSFDTRKIKTWNYENQNIRLEKGQEAGRFLLGSTVIALFPHHTVRWNPNIQPTDAVKMGQEIGTLLLS